MLSKIIYKNTIKKLKRNIKKEHKMDNISKLQSYMDKHKRFNKSKRARILSRIVKFNDKNIQRSI